ncbi:MAG: flagellar biosynthesis repressor FlbT [Caulobacteraceae bacterium]
MPLKLSLKPGETFVLNGAVIQNGDRRNVLVLQNQVSVLRERDIMQPQDANSPARRVYFPLMMMYLDAAEAPRYAAQFTQRLAEFTATAPTSDMLADCLSISKLVTENNVYKALMACRKLIEAEDVMFGHAAPGLEAHAAVG